jgi:hypothetical protein
MSETPNLDRFLQTKELWEEYTELSDELRELEAKVRSNSCNLALYTGHRVGDSIPLGKRRSTSEIALQGAVTSLQVRKTELAGVLRNTFHLEV